ncbi:potassium channel family protein [Peribacillus sp. SCS-155]|uniref:potassium channel protein n=1 Tax=Peribacillus sedimenti TaxID=3115297 RepID=UPI0039064B37
MNTFKRVLFFLIRLRGRIFFPFLLLYILLAALFAYMLEPQTFETYLTSIYWVLTTLATIGFGDYAPVTDAGKIYTIFLYITGIGLVSVFAGKMIGSMKEIERRRVGGHMKYKGKDHIILVGWSDKSKIAVQEILESDDKTEIVLIDHLPKAPMDLERLFYIRGDATDKETLMRANFPASKGVIIFADELPESQSSPKSNLLIDGKTLLVATAITSIEESMNLSIHVTAEVLDQKHIRLFRHVDVDEFIPTREMISHAAVSSLYHHGVTKMYAELMSRQCKEGMYEIPRKTEWITYRDAFEALLSQGATLIADHTDLQINKKLDEKIPENAQLFVICDKETLKRLQTNT